MDTLKRIEQLRDERSWSNYRLAKQANLSQTTIKNLFSRGTLPSIPTLEAICKGFGITLSQFFSDGKQPIVLEDEQREMLNMWNTLDDAQKNALMELLRRI